MRETIAVRRRHPGADVVSSLIEAGLDDEELLWIMFTFLGAGLGVVDITVPPRCRNPLASPVSAPLVEDPALIPTAYEELVRFDCGPQRFHLRHPRPRRRAPRRDDAGGDLVLVMYGLANRDERQFERADELLVDRYPNKHLGFGRGPHSVGVPLARLQGQVLFEILLAVAPDYAVHAEAALQWK